MTDLQEVPGLASPASPAELVEQYGMSRAGARLPLSTYTRELWGRRHFILAFARARSAVGYSTSLLGQAWQVLTPLLNAAVYYLIFGLLLHTNRGVHNFIAFLVTGIFFFSFTQQSVLQGSKAIHSNVGLTRVLQFPRAALPISTTVVALQQLLVSLVVLVPIVLLTGERPSVRWLLVVPAIGLQTLFCAGLALALARLGARVPDTSQFLPFVLRTWLYVSGIFYSITTFTKRFHSHLLDHVLTANPGAVYVEIVRDALLARHHVSSLVWPLAVVWAVVVFAGGYVYFWRAEEQYGRV